MKSVGRRTFLGLLGGAFAAIGLPLQILDPFRSGRKLAVIPGEMIIKRILLTVRSTVPGEPVISGVLLAGDGAERPLWKHWLNNPHKGTSVDWEFRDGGVRVKRGERLAVYVHNSPVRPTAQYQVEWEGKPDQDECKS